MRLHERFNHSGLSRFLNGRAGRAFRASAGAGLLAAGFAVRMEPAGVAAIAWSLFPLSAGVFDVCYLSAALGGPFTGARIREQVGRLGPRT